VTGAVLITGCNGGIGKALTAAFKSAGWTVVGADMEPTAGSPQRFVKADLSTLCSEENKLKKFVVDVHAAIDGEPIAALVNNAAVQILGGLGDLDATAIRKSMDVNAIAPFLLAKAFLADLKKKSGVIVNIGSVHAQATKPGFSAYATSKAALHGLTRALAVDLGPDIRVNTLAPAAVSTDMLKAGFEKNPAAYAALESVHPAGRIASPDEIARMAVYLTSKDASFITGATIYADGGILSRLHDPA